MPTWLPWLLLTLTGVVAFALLWYWVAGGEEEEEHQDEVDPLSVTASEDAAKDPFATTTEEYRGVGRKSRMIALRESLERSLDSREGIARGSTKDRMIMPWFLLVGADGSGKKTILANNGLELPWGPPIEVDSQRKDAGKWWLYDDAVVLEAPAASPGATEGSSTLPPDQTVVDSSIGWSTLLHMLRRERPDSPLNGIVVTISCADLIGARVNPEKLEEQADRIRIFLERTRKFLGVRLPLHVLVTKCDTLPGFRGFAESLPDGRRQDIFGWANPKDPELRFEPGWVDAGFMELQARLANLRDEVLAASEHVRDSIGVFVFDSEFSDLQEPLKTFVARLMPIGERRPSLFFRGFYFTGDVIDVAEAQHHHEITLAEQKQEPRSNTRISAEIAQEPHRMVFLKSLFSDRIFREAGLARPASRFRLARDRRVVLAQAAALVILLGGGFGLWSSVSGLHAADRASSRPSGGGLRADAELLTRVLSGVAIDLDELRHGGALGHSSPFLRRTRDAAVIQLVGQMRDVPPIQMRSPFIPSSWFSRLPAEIRESMAAGVRDIVLPVTRQRLLERAERLIGEPSAASFVPDELDPGDARTLSRYLSEVRALSRNIDRYNALADSTSGSLAELTALLEYLFGERFVTDSALASPEFEEALRRASAPRIVVSATMAIAVLQRAGAVVSTVASSAGRQLAPPRGRTVRPVDDLRALEQLGGLVQLLDQRNGLLASVGDSAVLGLRLARALRDSVAMHLQLAAIRIAPDTLSPDSSARRLHGAIARLYEYRLMKPITVSGPLTNQIPAGERLRWDVGSMELALTLRSEYLQAVVATAVAFPGQDPARLQRALQVLLRQRAIDAAANAQRFTRLGEIEDPIAEIRSQGSNLEGAASRVIRLAGMLDTLGASAEASRLIASAARQAEQTLALAQATLERSSYLVPNTAGIAAWRGVLPFAYAAMGKTDSLEFYTTLLSHETGIRALAHAAAPALRFLRLAAIADSVEAYDLLESWEDILTSVLRYERGDLSSTMGMLHRFIVTDLMVNSIESCRAAATREPGGDDESDLFVARRNQFRAALVGRCVPGASANAAAGYQRLRGFFETRLAGRFPFVDTASPARVDAVVADVRTFVGMYDAFVAGGGIALRSDPRSAQSARHAIAFLDQFSATREFLAPFAAIDAPREMPEYGLRVSASGLVDSVPLALVEVRVGRRQIGLEAGSQALPWRSGDSVSVEQTPFDTSAPRILFAAGGPWAALRFARQPGGIQVTLHHPETRMELPLPVFPARAQ